MVYLLHSIQDSEDQRKKENNLVRYRIPTSTDDSSKRSERKSNKSDQKRANTTTSDVVNKIKHQCNSLGRVSIQASFVQNIKTTDDYV